MVVSRKYIFILFGVIFTAVYCLLMVRTLTGELVKEKKDDRFVLEKALYDMYSREYGKNTGRITLPTKQQNEPPIMGVCRGFIFCMLKKNNDQFAAYLVGLQDSIALSFDIALMKKIVAAKPLDNFDSLLLFPEKLVFPINLFPFYTMFLAHCDTAFFGDTALFDAIKRAAVIYHSRDYIIAADTLFRLLETKFHVNDPEVIAWHGSVITKFALTTQSSVDKVDFVNKGVKMIDEALSRSPKNLNIRFIRYLNYLELPSFFKKRAIIMNDIEFLEKACIAGNSLEFVDRGKIRDTVLGKDKIIAALNTGIASPNISVDDKTELHQLLVQVESNNK
jgi:hypothetical protein